MMPDNNALQEECLRIESSRGQLVAMLHAPGGSPPKAAIVFCHPVLEERKNVYRCYVDTARMLARAGYGCLRFDYFGTGDSEGDHSETDLAAHLEGIACAVGVVRERFPSVELGLLGVRLGATLAARAAAEGTVRPDFLVLWEPVLSGKQLMSLEKTRQKLRKAITEKEAGAATDAPAARTVNDTIDLDGNPVSQRFWDDLESLVLQDDLLKLEGVRILLVQVSFREQLNPQLQRVIEAVRQQGKSQIDVECVKMQPVWNQLDPFDWSAPGEVTRKWLNFRDRYLNS